MADEGVRCSYKGRIYYKHIVFAGKHSSKNTRACADDENNTITERTGKVKIREVETRA